MYHDANQRRPPKYARPEPPLPPSTPPVMIEDDYYFDNPSNDRNNLLKCLQSLSEKTREALAHDFSRNDRYALRLKLSNRMVGTRRREELLVELPHTVTCWNDLDSESIELQMINAVINEVDDDYTWFKVRVFFDYFISKTVREYMDKIEKGESLITDPCEIAFVQLSSADGEKTRVISPVQPKPEEGTYRKPRLETMIRRPDPIVRVKDRAQVNKSGQNLSKRVRSQTHANIVPIKSDDNDDDDIEIVFEKVQSKK